MEKNLTNGEREVLLILYFSQFRKKLVGFQYGNCKEIISEIQNKQRVSDSWLRTTIRHFVELGILEEVKFIHKKMHYYINRDKIMKILNEDRIYNQMFKIVEDKYFLMLK